MGLVMRAVGSLHRRLYRLSDGKFGGAVGKMPILLLTTTGHKSGQERTCPVGYVTDGDRLLVVASALGQAAHPAWYLNLRANPRVTIRRGAETRPMVAETAAGEERARLWSRLIEDYPFFVRHQRKTTREIPIVILTRAAG
ncbi:MAG: hypothetical protein AVDCRST_MAG18-4942 [uncultured Thermomicrobiales bacterium]|uniref:AclJ n=1 Tax=uncultured Thermomicrobiales bacterium TaxID=1645740 RepID=A0A6J4VWH8_9BACT|nr:MAG: hypothetical protein AVDCRST_MAG18-4942 [uncultured Thermomicrobiales bacterium]